jgi:opacity protein-like surface antigen
MKTKKNISALLCFVALVVSAGADAQVNPQNDKGFYVGFSTAQARSSFDQYPAVAGGLPADYSNSSGTWKAFGGYQLNQYFGLELTYAKLGDFNAHINSGGVDLYTQIRTTAWTGSLVGTLPVGKGFSLLGKIGESYTRETRGDCNICVAPVTNSDSNIWSPTFGVGVKYSFTPNWSARVEAERYTKVGDSGGSTFGGRIDQWSAGVAYKF